MDANSCKESLAALAWLGSHMGVAVKEGCREKYRVII